MPKGCFKGQVPSAKRNVSKECPEAGCYEEAAPRNVEILRSEENTSLRPCLSIFAASLFVDPHTASLFVNPLCVPFL